MITQDEAKDQIRAKLGRTFSEELWSYLKKFAFVAAMNHPDDVENALDAARRALRLPRAAEPDAARRAYVTNRAVLAGRARHRSLS